MKKLINAIGRFMRRPVAVVGAGGFALVGILVGVVGYVGFHSVLEMTMTEEFCVSCHTMSDNAYEEYKTSIHYKNPAGVRATCTDCHVPKAGWPMYKAKVLAVNDLWAEIRGTINTPEKYEQERLRLAKRVWAHMEDNNSLECRSCHSYEAMDFEHQRPEASKMMKDASAKGETCIDCHKGIAHKLPDMASGYKALLANIIAEAPSNNKADTLYAISTTPLWPEKPADASARGAGNILPLTEVEVVSRSGDFIEVRIDGWMQEGMERVLVKEMGRRLFMATVTPAMAKQAKILETKTDEDTGLVWKDGAITVWTKASSFTSDRPGLMTYGADLYSASCGSCHSAHAPDHFLANQWMGVIKDMKGYTTLDKEQVRYLQNYLQLHAKDMPKES
ncbi:NapC/NirT family cytochrome c [Breoghania sp.]|uniref:NapC/NirT family cytochrome c n=1 Tax=Breoghania sp. TaxID=2065378 RepID=UPI0029CA4B6A|nr:NapC/NirT family cytochrome c [Breoghania sp.]